MGYRRARLVATSLTAVVSVGAVVAMAEAESESTADTSGEIAGLLAAAVGDQALAEMSAAESVMDTTTDQAEPVRVPRVRVRVS